jgi:hypothetical protein
MMAKRPEDRFQTAGEAAAALAAFVGPEAIEAPKPGPRTASVAVQTLPQPVLGPAPLVKGDTARGAAVTLGAAEAVSRPSTATPERKAGPPKPSHRAALFAGAVLGGALLLFLGVLAVGAFLVAGPVMHSTPTATAAPNGDTPAEPAFQLRPPRTTGGGRQGDTAEEPRFQPTPELEQWVEATRRLPAAQQVEAVAQRLVRQNEGYDGRLTHVIQDGQVVRIKLSADHITDLSPLRAFGALRELECTSDSPGVSRLTDLRPLQGLSLTLLFVTHTRVADLRPLREMPLRVLGCGGTQVSDLRPLAALPLDKLFECYLTPVVDLGPLRGKELATLNCSYTRIVDLTALQGMPLKHLMCGSTPIADLSPLSDSPLVHLDCAQTPVNDLSPLRGKQLVRLGCFGCRKVTDLSALKGMPLELLIAQQTGIKDLAFAKTLTKLKVLQCGETPITDLAPLKGLPLEELNVRGIKAADPTVLQTLPLKKITLDFRLEKDGPWLRQVKTLETINNQPAAAFWRAVDPAGVLPLRPPLPPNVF